MSKSPFSLAFEKGYSSLPIIPLQPKSKRPIKSLLNWTKYCQEMPPADLMKSWCDIEGANVGLALGKCSGIIALDFDNDVDGIHAEICKHIPISPVRKVGMRGYTMFYKYNGELPSKWSVDGEMILELLSTGNQTVIPPSVHPEGGSYRYSSTLPLIGNLDRLQTLPAGFKDLVDGLLNKASVKGGTAESSYSLPEIKAALEYIDPEDYEVWLKVGMALKAAFGLDAFVVWSEWSMQSQKCKSNELLPKWNSFKRDGTTLGTVIYYAKNGGYNKPVDMGSALVDIDSVKETILQWAKHGKPVGYSYGWKALDNLIHIRKGEFTLITGYTNQGKSEFMDAVAVNLMKDLDWRVGFFSMEKTKENHVAQLLHTLGGKPLTAQTPAEIDSSYKKLKSNALIVDHINIDKDITKMTEVIRFLASDRNVDAVVIDPFNYLTTTDESLYTHVMRVCKTCTNLAKEFNIHVFLVAHAKDAQYDKEGRLKKPGMYSVFGGTQFSNIVDNLIGVTRKDSLTLIETLKIRDQDCDTYGTITLQFNKEERKFYEPSNDHQF